MNNTTKNYTAPFISLIFLFFMWGFMTVLNDILIPYLKGAFKLNHVQAMLIQLAFFGAYFIGSVIYFVISVFSGDPINKIGYTITVTASLSSGNSGGYGAFFETTLKNDNPKKDTGYILQFDRGWSKGAIIVRPREDGSELSPIWKLLYNKTDLFPSKADDPDWWTDIHVISIEVKIIDETTKEATFLLDSNVLGSLTIDSVTNGDTIYTGLRSWSTTTSFYNMEID